MYIFRINRSPSLWRLRRAWRRSFHFICFWSIDQRECSQNDCKGCSRWPWSPVRMQYEADSSLLISFNFSRIGCAMCGRKLSRRRVDLVIASNLGHIGRCFGGIPSVRRQYFGDVMVSPEFSKLWLMTPAKATKLSLPLSLNEVLTSESVIELAGRLNTEPDIVDHFRGSIFYHTLHFDQNMSRYHFAEEAQKIPHNRDFLSSRRFLATHLLSFFDFHMSFNWPETFINATSSFTASFPTVSGTFALTESFSLPLSTLEGWPFPSSNP